MRQSRYPQTRILLLLILCMEHAIASQPSVTVQSSTLYGLETQVGETTVHEYLGIRFGQPPVGPLRFSKPQPAPLPSVVNCTQQGSPCPGLLPAFTLHEDCLFLNVYVPQSGSTGGLLPVMVWIYGGSFIFGSTRAYDGSTLAVQGKVIVVTLNYRLGPLGFLSTGDNSSPGNYGLWDQQLALKWVNDNIEQFGGDVGNITLFGESAGGASVSYHMTSPHSVNLFQRAILQSGCRLCYWAYNSTTSPLEFAKRLGGVLQCPVVGNDTDATARLVSCLRQKPIEAIHGAAATVRDWTPVTDGDFVLSYGNSQTFAGAVMTGVNNREGGLLLSLLKAAFGVRVNSRVFYRQNILMDLLRKTQHPLMTSAPAQAVQDSVDVLECAYRVDTSNDTYVPDSEVEAVSGDSTFFICNEKLLDSEVNTGDTYMYYFDHYPDITGGDKGMDHSMDLPYTFGFQQGYKIPVTSPFAGQNISAADISLAADFRTLLTNFAKSGNPNQPSELPNWPKWLLYDRGNKSYLAVTSSPRVRSRLKEDKMTIWLKTIPALLRGDLRLNDTRWRQCFHGRGKATENQTGSASFITSFNTSMALCFLIALALLS